MRSLRASPTVCSSWATAWPTTRKAWTTRRTSRPCAREEQGREAPAGTANPSAAVRKPGPAGLSPGKGAAAPLRLRRHPADHARGSLCGDRPHPWAGGGEECGIPVQIRAPEGRRLRWDSEDPLHQLRYLERVCLTAVPQFPPL
ncbi:neuritin isoform X1 [Tamandua tetradactyla]|uniref:neuritin isoform X1 n=1 Tax=Tamandua tetradactyla TaxID=48850 RepID=UPI004053B1EC